MVTSRDSRRAVIDAVRRHRVLLLLISDTTVILGAYSLVAWGRYDLSADSPPWRWVFFLAAVALVVHVGVALLLKLYRGRARIGSVDETLLLAVVTGCGSVCAELVNVIDEDVRVGRSVPLVAGVIALSAMVVLRAAWRNATRFTAYAPGADRRRTVVIGAGDGGRQLVESMRRSVDSPFAPVALLDDDPWKRHLRIEGVPVRGTLADLERVAATHRAEAVVVAIPSATGELLSDISDRAAAAGLEAKVLPSVAELFTENVSIRDIRDINLADILGRGQIDTDVDSIAHYLAGKRVLVTGAGGSIGAELSRQIHRWEPAELMLLDRDESALHGVQLAIHGHGLLDSSEVILADIRDAAVIREIFEERRPEVVFHAAALKHLPMLEQYPLEGVKTNVIGTLNVLRAAEAVGVERLVNISTDKATDPTSVLGLTKRVAERLTASYAHHDHGAFMSVRFGNVLGSRGSVLTAWAAQIGQGGPVTVTHPDVTRYFMTIAEACQLVLQAGAFGGDGETLILDMGEPVRIVDVARKLIAQSGREIDIVYTGLRNGEKLDEVLISETEDDYRPHHELITHVAVPPLPESAVEAVTYRDVEAARSLLQDWCRVAGSDTQRHVDGEPQSATYATGKVL